MTIAEIYALIDSTIKVNPLATSTDKTRGADERALLKRIVDHSETSVSVPFNGEVPITAAIPGLQGMVLHGTTEKEVTSNFLKALFPALAPTCILIASDPQREHGADGDTILYYNAFGTTNALATLTVNGAYIDVDINQGSQHTATVQDVNKTFTMTATDTAGLTTSASASVNYYHNRFWFASATDLLAASDADLSTLLQGLGTKEFATSRQQSRTFTLNDEYSYFAYLDSYGDASFTVGGLPNTAYQERAFQYENPNGYVATFRLYRSGGKGTGSIGVVLN